MSNTRLDGFAGIYEMEMAKSIKAIQSSGDHARVNLTDAVGKFISDAFLGALGVPHHNPSKVTIAGYDIPKHCTVLIPNGTGRARGVLLGAFPGRSSEIQPRAHDAIPGMPIASCVVPFVVANLLHAFDWKSAGEIDLSEKSGTPSHP
ncbi:ent-cassadiene C11-alpha-hydroxylase 1-like [Selaginella moellendorffii]|uniref:ent-cassadiene C11-alpha-hydroxylase 1-like n=1 Tax=Selaginella moellendorffii TaxID=88036 RepID=UPI000D1CAB3F|nr:ent-cassadiene C11-alpha-hydroxylase 1-like [Selaginella moellendorffii]|eukprot:XP_024545452.1 ent-cassadiene C11-alpha-hydroxylase 1-like [Selaginella moellendorffii]